MSTSSSSEKKQKSENILRFAHPYFNPGADLEKVSKTTKGKHLVDYIQTKLLPIPPPQPGRTPVMTLENIIGAAGVQAVTASGSLSFHTMGDSGHENGEVQELIAEAMALDYNIADEGHSPSFLLHLGDVIYYDNTDRGYQSQFYIPYKRYPGKIIAIPGNHDGELFKFNGRPTGQKTTLEAFQRNFCQRQAGVPPDAGTIYREMVSQPAVYWWLQSPFIDIVALYSNIGEGQGFISGKIIGQKQKDWLVASLKAIRLSRDKGERKALVIAVHHPPFSNGGHSSSNTMLQDIDDACQQAGILPDAVLAAHAHNYQRFTRFMHFDKEKWEIPYYVVGTGGRGTTPLEKADGQQVDDHVYISSLKGYGYLNVKASADELVFQFMQVEESGARHVFDEEITVDLKAHKIV